MPGLLPLSDFEIQSAPFTSMIFFFPCLPVQVYPGIRKLSLSCPRWWQSYKTVVAFLGEGLWLKHGLENRAAAVPSFAGSAQLKRGKKSEKI